MEEKIHNNPFIQRLTIIQMMRVYLSYTHQMTKSEKKVVISGHYKEGQKLRNTKQNQDAFILKRILFLLNE